jgi:hypothetical protein
MKLRGVSMLSPLALVLLFPLLYLLLRPSGPQAAAAPAPPGTADLLAEVQCLDRKTAELARDNAELRKELKETRGEMERLARESRDQVTRLAGRRFQVAASGDALLGNAEDKAGNVEHTATSDGIVVVYTGGNTPPMYTMVADGKQLAQSATGYSSGTIAVHKGATWRVTAIDAQARAIPPNGMYVRFIPIRLPKLEIQEKK